MFSNFLQLYKSKISLIVVCGVILLSSQAIDLYATDVPQQKTTVKGKKQATGNKKQTTGKSASKKGTTNKTTSNKGTTNKGTTTKTPTKNKQATNKSATPAARRKTGAAQSSSRNNVKNETSADVKKRQEATQKEIKLTEQQIKENEKSIKKGLNELGKLGGDIAVSKKKIEETSGKISSLSTQIESLEGGILKNESELQKLRDEYLNAVKKMRVARKNRSELAFIFASDNFHQALRRMRYLKQFSAWKDRQSEEIGNKTAELKHQRDQLASAKAEQDKALQLQQSEQTNLQQQYGKQDAIVAQLRANGKALQTHLSKKQAEANELRNRISALIAAEEKARQEAAKKAEQERLAKEQARKAAEEKAKNDQLLAQNESDRKGKTSDKNQGKTDKNSSKEDSQRKKESGSGNKGKNTNKKDDGKNYADARKRNPRSETGSQNVASKETAAGTEVVKGTFPAMKGSLPYPVSGHFKVTSRFGRQALPDLPDVVYDNPGIDAEVSSGASALAVYNGKVSGVYMIPGYNTVVIVNHGNYYTVYGNISNPSVKVGDAVNVGQALGKLAPDEDDTSHSSIHFEVWRNREKLNPMEWLR